MSSYDLISEIPPIGSCGPCANVICYKYGCMKLREQRSREQQPLVFPTLPAVATSAWQCPGCRTWYAPFVAECGCQKA